jgi:lysozyme
VLKVSNDANLSLSQNEADALASLVYNLGPGILDDGRTMGSALRSRNRARIASAFLVYDMAGGQHLPGLARRRRAERALFLKG